MSGPVKVFEMRLDAGDGGLDFTKFDVDGSDGLFYMIGYIAGIAFEGRPPKESAREALSCEPDCMKGYDHATAVHERKVPKPAWHCTELELLALLTKSGVFKASTLVTILHDRAEEAGKHICKPHEKKSEEDDSSFTGSTVLKA